MKHGVYTIISAVDIVLAVLTHCRPDAVGHSDWPVTNSSSYWRRRVLLGYLHSRPPVTPYVETAATLR